ncbi:MAG: 16S rRNA (cytosine(967)-C(5))-methyltransferase [Lachnospiraceae bacterium]|nr:16S rRNA (cytosine(967)-C(5))-methyltransferase [Lachnospiraceae bacterium]
MNEREIILDILTEILEKGAYSHLTEKAVLDKYDYLPSRSKAFIKRVTEVTVEELLLVDEVIDRYASLKVKKQKPLIRTVLRMSTAQLVYFDRVPSAAIVNEAVKLVRKRGFSNLSGFVNGTLRSIGKDREALSFEMSSRSPVPSWIIDHLSKHYGAENAAAVLDDIRKEHPVFVRYRGEDPAVPVREGLIPMETAKDEPGGTHAGILSLLPRAYALPKGVSAASLPGFSEGLYIVQDSASQFAVCCAGIKKGDLVIDLCASPGGKTVGAFDCGGEVIARDIGDARIAMLKDTVSRCESLNRNGGSIRIADFDATVTDETLREKADVVLADLPCSGLGVLTRKSDLRSKTKKEDLLALRDLQRKILDASACYVKKGGTLLYSTCTLNPSENEEQAQYLIERHGFVLRPDPLYLPEGMRTLLPGRDGTDGFFIARLSRKE